MRGELESRRRNPYLLLEYEKSLGLTLLYLLTRVALNNVDNQTDVIPCGRNRGVTRCTIGNAIVEMAEFLHKSTMPVDGGLTGI